MEDQSPRQRKVRQRRDSQEDLQVRRGRGASFIKGWRAGGALPRQRVLRVGELSQEAGSRPGEEVEGLFSGGHGGAEGGGHCHRGGQAYPEGGKAGW